MPFEETGSAPRRLASASGLSVDVNANGSIRRIDYRDVVLNLFPGSELEGGPINLYLRRTGAPAQAVPLLGPCSPARFAFDGRTLQAVGRWQDLRFTLALVLAETVPAWFWQIEIENTAAATRTVDLMHTHDVALAPYSAVRLNEHYVSHYIDHAPLAHPERGGVVASRQNLAAAGRFPWTVIGSLRRGVAFATDALQFYGLASRAGSMPVALAGGLPGERRQHEHSMVAIQDAPLQLAPGARASLGFFGWIEQDHPAATSAADLSFVDRACALPEARWTPAAAEPTAAPAPSLFAAPRLLAALDLTGDEISARFGDDRRSEERDGARLLSFFASDDRHVVLRAKELDVLRPHGHILRSGAALTPDETALTSTTWMGGVFHSMLTQGHVSINRCLSTVHGYLGLFRAHGQRVFVEIDGRWHLLDLPSVYEMAPDRCRWIYKHAGGVIEVRSQAHDPAGGQPHEMSLAIDVRAGAAARFLVCHHIALNGDDGAASGAVRYAADDGGIFITPAPGADLARRFPGGGLRIAAREDTVLQRVGGDELLFVDGVARGEPYLCVVTAAATSVGLRLLPCLVADSADRPAAGDTGARALSATHLPQLSAPAHSALAVDVARLAQILPWYTHDALIHYLAPRGLEQYSGGGWGTRDACQGPVELLLALGCVNPVRDLLLRVFNAQNPDGDWPQWFTFFERERGIRAGDSHGDIVFWPLLALAQYLIASGDASLLDEAVPFFHSQGTAHAEHVTVWQHVERALAVIDARTIAGTRLVAYGHGDWNDALQPADPAMRERMCSAWTVTLHKQVCATLATALRRLLRSEQAAEFEQRAARVLEDFRRLMVVGGVVAGYALFERSGRIDYLLHPRDLTTGVRYSVLPMIHAILNDMLSPQEARLHLHLIATHLTGPDGVRLFDRPMAYHGGPQRQFQRAEGSAFFGREIGLMYTHAHLRYAEALAHMGEAECFFEALCKANPIGLQAWVPTATRRQSNCYYSSSDAVFSDRYQASAEYDRVARGEIALEGGWRVYSSGPGIALSLIVRSFLGIRREKSTLVIDPVMPRALDGLRAEIELDGRRVAVTYRVGAAGCGPTAVTLNGASLPFARGANPYRVGAAHVPMADCTGRLTGGGDAMIVQIG